MIITAVGVTAVAEGHRDTPSRGTNNEAVVTNSDCGTSDVDASVKRLLDAPPRLRPMYEAALARFGGRVSWGLS